MSTASLGATALNTDGGAEGCGRELGSDQMSVCDKVVRVVLVKVHCDKGWDSAKTAIAEHLIEWDGDDADLVVGVEACQCKGPHFAPLQLCTDLRSLAQGRFALGVA